MLSTICKLVVPLGFEPRSEEPESSMMDRYTKGLYGVWVGEPRGRKKRGNAPTG